MIKVSAAILRGDGDSPFATLRIDWILPFGLDVLLEYVVIASLRKGTCWLQIIEYSADCIRRG